jgi:hypothetical protein
MWRLRTATPDQVTGHLHAAMQGYEQVRGRDGLLHPKQLVLPQVPPRRSAGQCRCSIAHVLWIGSTILVFLRKEVRPVGNLAIPKDVDRDEHEVCRTSKDAA